MADSTVGGDGNEHRIFSSKPGSKSGILKLRKHFLLKYIYKNLTCLTRSEATLSAFIVSYDGEIKLFLRK